MDKARKESLFKVIDNFLFKQIDQFKTSAAYEKLAEQMGKVDEDIRRPINQATIIFLISLPILIIVFFFILNLSLKRDINMKKEIITMSQEILGKNREVKLAANQVYNSSNIRSKNKLFQNIKDMALGLNIETKKLSLKSFDSESYTPTSTRVEGDLHFAGLGLAEFTGLVESLAKKQKLKFGDIKIKKDKKTQLLFGQVQVIHIGQSGNVGKK